MGKTKRHAERRVQGLKVRVRRKVTALAQIGGSETFQRTIWRIGAMKNERGSRASHKGEEHRRKTKETQKRARRDKMGVQGNTLKWSSRPRWLRRLCAGLPFKDQIEII